VAELQAGRLISHYRLVEKIGEGGMGEVWKAQDVSLGRSVAVKVLPHAFSSDPDRRQRFRREARSAAALNHPNITVIHEIAEEAETLFIVMELVEGRTLRDRIRQGPLPMGELLPIAAAIAQGLAHAHAQGILHRDLKPDNVMVASGGQVKLLDFGLAKLLRPVEESVSSRTIQETISAEMTREGSFAGTVAYMSPELARGKRADFRSDQFSFGVMLYEMAAGTRPFQGETWAATLAKILETEPAPLRTHRKEVPETLERGVHRCLSKDPDKRYADTADLAREIGEMALAEVSGTRAVSASGAHGHEHPRRWLAVAAVAVALQAGILGFFLGIYPNLVSDKKKPAAALPAAALSQAVVVLPFEFHGDPQFTYLGEGIVKLLGAALDGAGSLRSVDARATLGAVEQTKAAPSDPEAARALSHKLGAGKFVLGDIVEAGGQLRLQASLYDSERAAAAPLARAEAQGKPDQLFQMVDSLAGQILAARPEGPSERVNRVAAVTTHSIPALKAYLEGESLFRQGRFVQALDSFQRAVAEDPEFALAYYRLSIAAEWGFRSTIIQDAAEKAVQHSNRLSQHDRLLLKGLLAWRRGSTEEAERVYRTVLGEYPDEVEAWFELGEVLFHGGPPLGRPVTEARGPFEKVLSFEPDHVPSLLHVARLAMQEGDADEVEALTGRVLRVSSAGERALEAKAILAYSRDDPDERQRFLSEARLADDNAMIISSNVVALHSPDPGAGIEALRLLTEASRVVEMRAMGHIQIASSLASLGKFAAAWEETKKASVLKHPWGMEGRAFLGLVPMAPQARSEMESAYRELASWDPATAPTSNGTNTYLVVHDGYHRAVRRFLLAILGTRLGRPEALDQIPALEKEPLPKAAPRNLASDLVRSVKGQAAFAHGEETEALRLLDPPLGDVPYLQMIASPFFSRPQDRFALAELLESEGRPDEALRWYGSFARFSIYDAMFEAPASLRAARLCEKLGRTDDAIVHYERFLELWSDPDPELKPQVDEARAALARLER
jgi:tetratricopeptide (TPR) repeat protein